MSSHDFNVVSSDQAELILRSAILDRVPVCILGRPGDGKSAITEQVSNAIGHQYFSIYSANRDPSDLNDWPFMDQESKTIIQVPSPFLSSLPIDTDLPAVLNFDEIGQAPAMIQAALGQLIYPPYKIGSWYKPEEWSITMTANRASDRSNSGRLLAHFTGRMEVITLITELGSLPGKGVPDGSGWLRFALRAGIAHEVVAYLQQYPQNLSTIEKDMEKERSNAAFKQVQSATPRQWERVSNKISNAKARGETLIRPQLVSMLGEDVGGEFHQFLELIEHVKDIPTTEEIIADPLGVYCPNPNDPHRFSMSLTWMISQRVAHSFTKENKDALAQYIGRLPPDYIVPVLVQACRKDVYLMMSSGGHFDALLTRLAGFLTA